MSEIVLCPYCSKEAAYMTTFQFYGIDYQSNLYVCHECDARVGTHKGTSRPFGTMANKELRDLRMECHSLVDPIWKNPFNSYSRSKVYKSISKVMNIPIEDTHIGMFDKLTCQALLFFIRSGELERHLATKPFQHPPKKKVKKGFKDNNTTEVPIPKGTILYGIYSAVSKKFVFGIQEQSKSKAHKKLFKHVGKDAYKWRFEARKLKFYVTIPEGEDAECTVPQKNLQTQSNG